MSSLGLSALRLAEVSLVLYSQFTVLMPDDSDFRSRSLSRQQSRGTYESVGNAASYLLDEIFQPVSQELFIFMAYILRKFYMSNNSVSKSHFRYYR